MKKILFIACSICSINAFAQVTANDELKNLVHASFEYFPQVKEVENTILIAEEKLEATKINLPTVSADAMYNYLRPKIEIEFPLGPEGEIKNIQFVPVHNVNTAVTGNYTLFDFGRLKSAIEKAKTNVQLAKDNAGVAKAELASKVATIYYNIVYYKKAIAIEDSVLAYLGDNRSIIESKLRNGDAIRIDLLNIQANIDAEMNRKVDLQNALQKQLNLLAYTTGTSNISGMAFDFNTPGANADEMLSEALRLNPSFNVANTKIQLARDEAETIKLTDKPTVNVHAGAGFKNGYIPEIGNVRFNYLAGVSLNVPIYDGGKTKKQITIAETLVKQNQLSLQTLSSTFRIDIEQALTDINTNLQRIENTASQVALAKEGRTLAANRYLNDVGTNLEITNAATNVQRAEFTRLQYEYQLCLARIELARLTGYTFW